MLMANFSTDRQIDAILINLYLINDVKKELQENDLNFSHTRAIFDSSIDEFPSMKSRLGCNARIVSYP